MIPDIKKNKTKILAADDDPVLRETFSAFLRDPAYEVFLAMDGADALEKAAANPPDIIFLDLIMPAMDGFETLQKLRNLPETRNTPVIIVTSKTDADTLLKALNLGAADFITKPFMRGDLYRKMENVLRQKSPPQNHETALVDDQPPCLNDAPFEKMRENFIRNFENIYLILVKLIAARDSETLKETLSRLLKSVNFYQFKGAKEKVLQMRLAVHTGDWDKAIETLEVIYNLFRDLQRTLPQTSL
jgi:DNA-binding response OmpR family regulator